MAESCDIIIVGAGLSGLYAGTLLSEAGLTIKILEYRNRVSGRQYTHRDPEFQYADTGGAYVGEGQTKILQVLKELKLETYDVWHDLKSVIFYNGKKMIYSGDIPTFSNPFVLIDLNNIMRLIDEYSKEITLGNPMDHPKAYVWDSMNCEEVTQKYCWTETAKVLLNHVLELPFTCCARDFSFLDLLHSVKGCGGIDRLLRVKGGLQAMKIKGGSSQISDRLAAKMEGRIRLNTCVNNVDDSGDGVFVTAIDTQSHETLQYQAKKLIFAVPLPQLSTIAVEPPLPENIRIYSEAQPLGASFKVNVYYKNQFWRDHGLSGEMVSLSGGLISYCLDDTKPDGSYPSIMGFIAGDTARNAQEMTQEERQRRITQQLSKEFGLGEFLSPVSYFEKNWNDEDSMSTGRGCCVWTLPPGVHSKALNLPGEPFGNMHIAGTETCSTMQGYMDGALRAGERAAVQIFEAFDIQTAYQDETNVEIPYLERGILEKYLPGVPGCLAILTGLSALTTGLIIQQYM